MSVEIVPQENLQEYLQGIGACNNAVMVRKGREVVKGVVAGFDNENCFLNDKFSIPEGTCKGQQPDKHNSIWYIFTHVI